MARNRKRAKERRARRPQGSAVRPGVRGIPGVNAVPELGAPDPLEHAAPDAELADAQLAVGRPEPLDEAELEAEADAEAQELELADGGRRRGGPPSRSGGGGTAPGAVPESRGRPASRFIGFIQGSWRELQRVQWPDRRQVVQATSVVLGFVIVAGVYLGVADTLASKLMDFVLK